MLAASAVAVNGQPGSGIVIDGRGAVYFTDTGRGPWKIDASGKVAAHDGPPFHFMAMDPDGKFAGVPLPSSSTAEIKHAGSRPTLILSSDVPVVIGKDGALYYPQKGQDERLQIIRLTSSGVHSVFATLPATSEDGPLQWLNGMAAGPDGSIYYTENRAIRRISSEGSISTIATSIVVPDCRPPPGYNNPKLGPHLHGIDVAADGTVFAAATGCAALIRVGVQGDVAPVLRAVPPWSPTGVAIAGKDLYVLEYLHPAPDARRDWAPRVRELSADGKISLLAEILRR